MSEIVCPLYTRQQIQTLVADRLGNETLVDKMEDDWSAADDSETLEGAPMLAFAVNYMICCALGMSSTPLQQFVTEHDIYIAYEYDSKIHPKVVYRFDEHYFENIRIEQAKK